MSTVTIPDLLVFDPPQSIPVPRVPDQTVAIREINFTRFCFTDDERRQTLVALTPYFGTTPIMGGNARAPYNPDWTRQDARTAFLAQVGLTLPPAAPSTKAAS